MWFCVKNEMHKQHNILKNIRLVKTPLYSMLQVNALKDRLSSMQDQNEVIDNIQSKFDRERALLEEQLKTSQLLLEQVSTYIRLYF